MCEFKRSCSVALSNFMARSCNLALSPGMTRSYSVVHSVWLARFSSLVRSLGLAVMPDVLTPAFRRLGFSVDADPDLASRLWRWPCMT